MARHGPAEGGVVLFVARPPAHLNRDGTSSRRPGVPEGPLSASSEKGGRAGSSLRPCRSRAWDPFCSSPARGRYGRSMKSGPRAINDDGIDRAKAPNTRDFSKARSIRSVLRATTTAQEDRRRSNGSSGWTLPRRAMRRRVISGGAERGARDDLPRLLPRAVQAGAGGSRRLASRGRRRVRPSEGQGEKLVKHRPRIDRAAPGFDEAPAKRGDPRRSIRGRYSPFAVGTVGGRAISGNAIDRQKVHK